MTEEHHRRNQRYPPLRPKMMQPRHPRSVGMVGALAMVLALVIILALVMTRCGSHPATLGIATPFVPPNFASLSPSEICGLSDEATVNATFDYTFQSVDGMAHQYAIDKFGSSCRFDATSDGFQADRLSVGWFVGALTVADGHFRQSPYGVQQGQKRTPVTIDGHPATVFINAETTNVQMTLADRVLSVETFTDNDSRKPRLVEQSMAFMKMLDKATSRLQPRPLQSDDAAVPKLFEMTPGQACSLLRNSTVATLSSDSMSRAQPLPGAYDTTDIEPDRVSCTKGPSKLELRITNYAPGKFLDACVGGLPARWSTVLVDEADPRSQRLQLEVTSVRNLLDTPEERLISLIVDSTNDTPAIRVVVQREMEHVLDELNRRLPSPLVNPAT